MTPLTTHQRRAYERRVRYYEEALTKPINDDARELTELALYHVEGFLAIGMFAGDECCLDAELELDLEFGGLVCELMHRIDITLATHKAGK